MRLMMEPPAAPVAAAREGRPAPARIAVPAQPADYYPLQQAHSTRRMYAQHLCAYVLAARQLVGRPAAGVRVLDAGCGQGYGTAFLADHGVETALGADLLVDQLIAARARFRRPGLGFVGADLLQLGARSGQFDLVCSFQVIEHLPVDRQPDYLREIARVLKPGGVFVVSTLNRAVNMKSPATYQPNPDHTHEFVWPELLELLRKVFRVAHPYSLRPTAGHAAIQRLKRSGLCRSLPARWNPVTRFYDGVGTDDFTLRPGVHPRTIDLLCLCKVR